MRKSTRWLSVLAVFVLAGAAVVGLSAANFFTCGPSGGTGGTYFTDDQTAGRYSSDNRRLSEVRVRSGIYIDAIQTVYVNSVGQTFTSPWHGGKGGALSVFKLDPDEYIVRVNGKHGWFIDHLEIVTNKGRMKGWGGTGGQRSFIYTAPQGAQIISFFGYCGDYLDAVGVSLK